VQESTTSTCQELATQLETSQTRAALVQQQVRGEQARLDEADKAVRALFDSHARENKIWKEATEDRVAANHEMALRVRENFGGELRLIQSGMAESQRDAALKWQQLDAKLTDDSRRILQAMQSFRGAHETLKRSTDEHFSQVLAQDEKNLTRLWADVEGNRSHCDKLVEELRERMGSEEHERKEATALLHALLDTARQDQNNLVGFPLSFSLALSLSRSLPLSLSFSHPLTLTLALTLPVSLAHCRSVSLSLASLSFSRALFLSLSLHPVLYRLRSLVLTLSLCLSLSRAHSLSPSVSLSLSHTLSLCRYFSLGRNFFGARTSSYLELSTGGNLPNFVRPRNHLEVAPFHMWLVPRAISSSRVAGIDWRESCQFY